VAVAAAAVAYFAIFHTSPDRLSPQPQSPTQIATQSQSQPAFPAPPSGVSSNGYVSVPQAANSQLPKTNANAGKTSNRPVNLQDATREPQIALNPVVSTPVGNAGAVPAAPAPSENRTLGGTVGGAVGGASAGNVGTPVAAPEFRRDATSAPPPAPSPAKADESLAKKQSEDKVSSATSNPNAQSQQNLDQAIAASQGQANTQQPAPQQSASRMTSSGNFKSRARDAGALSNISAVLIFPTQGSSEWSIGENGRIDKSTDSGGTWQHQQSGVTSQLLAGSAPNDLVCWVVGRDAVILRTVDGGKSWTKVPDPQSLNGSKPDWTGVFATDAQHARISSVDGKSYSTTDGGQTWTANTL
jgi:Photosynthesis system II assembly factor YCF48